MNTLPSPAVRRRVLAFTITELLVVLSVILILSALTVPTLGPLMSSYNLNSATSMVNDELAYAHQAALSQNTDIEVRFYQLGSSSSPTDLQYRAFRSVVSSTGQPLEILHYLPSPFVISSNTQFSTILDYTNSARGGLTTNTEVLPGGKGSAPYVSFVFRATGGTGLTPVTPPTGLWNLTIYSENAPIQASTSLPNNFATIMLDPVTGHLQIYRP